MSAKVMGAAPLFAERGLDGVKISDIAAVTGIPRATLYYHFEGKEAVFSHMCTIIFDAFEDAVSRALATPGSAAHRLSCVIRAQIDVYAAYPVALRAIILDLGRAAGRPEIVERNERSYLRPVVKLLEEGVVDGSLRPVENPRAVAAALLGSMTFAAKETLFSTDENSVSKLHEAMVSLVLQGLTAAPEGIAATVVVSASVS
jgi:AcrR family transcriptional regulator